MTEQTAQGPTLLVAVKHVPVGGAFLRVDGDRLTRDGVSHGIDPLNEVGLEWALQARDAGVAARVVAVSMGPSDAVETLRRAIAMGADEGLLVTDDTLIGADVRTTARALAAVVRHVGADLLITGYESLDASSGVVPAATAALLGWPVVSRFGSGELSATTLRGSRDLGTGATTVEMDLPGVVSFVEGHVLPRYPKLKQVLQAKNREIPTLSAADLGLVPSTSNETVARLVHVPQPPRQARVVGFDEGVRELVDLLTGGQQNG